MINIISLHGNGRKFFDNQHVGWLLHLSAHNAYIVLVTTALKRLYGSKRPSVSTLSFIDCLANSSALSLPTWPTWALIQAISSLDPFAPILFILFIVSFTNYDAIVLLFKAWIAALESEKILINLCCEVIIPRSPCITILIVISSAWKTVASFGSLLEPSINMLPSDSMLNPEPTWFPVLLPSV